MNAVLKRIEDARTTLVLDCAFYGHLSLKMNIKLDAEGRYTRTAATDGRTCFFHPDYVAKLTDAQLLGLWAHEVSHPAALHHTRRGARDPVLWNQAADYSINSHLLADGFELPEGGCVDEELAKLSAEQIYAELKKRQQAQQNQQESEAEEQAEDDARGDDGEAEDDGEESEADDADDGEESPDNDVSGDEGDEADGEGAGEAQDEGDAEAQAGESEGTGSPGEPLAGELADVPGAVLDAAEPSTEEAEWQVNVDQALNAARMMGQLPGAGMMALAGDAKQSRTDWKAITRRFVQETAAADYSWKMPNPRYMASGIYLPRLKSENMPPIIGVIDTSASTIPYQAGFVAELGLIFDETQAEALIIIETDAGVHRVTRFERGDPVVLKELKGQGGTDFRPAFDYIEREQIEAACVIYLTDAYGTYPQPSEIPTLWALTPNAPREGEADFPPFGETVRLDEGDL